MAATNLAQMSSSGRRSRKQSHASGDPNLVDDVTEGLKSASDGSNRVLHFDQVLSRKDVEIGQLRNKVFEVRFKRSLKTLANVSLIFNLAEYSYIPAHLCSSGFVTAFLTKTFVRDPAYGSHG